MLSIHVHVHTVCSQLFNVIGHLVLVKLKGIKRGTRGGNSGFSTHIEKCKTVLNIMFLHTAVSMALNNFQKRDGKNPFYTVHKSL